LLQKFEKIVTLEHIQFLTSYFKNFAEIWAKNVTNLLILQKFYDSKVSKIIYSLYNFRKLTRNVIKIQSRKKFKLETKNRKINFFFQT